MRKVVKRQNEYVEEIEQILGNMKEQIAAREETLNLDKAKSYKVNSDSYSEEEEVKEVKPKAQKGTGNKQTIEIKQEEEDEIEEFKDTLSQSLSTDQNKVWAEPYTNERFAKYGAHHAEEAATNLKLM